MRASLRGASLFVIRMLLLSFVIFNLKIGGGGLTQPPPLAYALGAEESTFIDIPVHEMN